MRTLLLIVFIVTIGIPALAQEEKTYYDIGKALQDPTKVKTLYLHSASTIDSTLWDSLPQLIHLKSLTFGFDKTMTKLPPIVFQLQQLEYLAIRNCPIDTIPLAIKQLQGLQKIVIESTEIKYYPEAINQLFNLTHLELHNMYKTTVLPKSMGKLRKLKYLSIKHTALSDLPPSMKRLQQLEELVLVYNKFTALPAVINKLKGLKKLNISSNKIKETPEFSSRLKQLESIDLGYNKITNFPTTTLQLPTLQELILTRNPLQIPQSLGNHNSSIQSIDIGYCGLTRFPTALASLPELKELYSRRNNLETIKKVDVEAFQQLKKLDLYKSGIKKIEEGVFFGKELQEINLILNELEKLPNSMFKSTKLQKVDASFCYITAIPKELGQLDSLKSVDFKYNQLQLIPFELKKKLGEKLNVLGNPFTVSRDKKMAAIAATQSTMTDPRDGQKYPTVTIDGSTWMTAYLNYKTENSILDTLIENNGRMYQRTEYNQVCPASWHTATTLDWKKLVQVIYQYFPLDSNERYNKMSVADRTLYGTPTEESFITFDPFAWDKIDFGKIGAYFVAKDCTRKLDKVPYVNFLGLNLKSKTYARGRLATIPISTNIYLPALNEQQKWDTIAIELIFEHHKMNLIKDSKRRQNIHYHLRCVKDE